MYTIKKLSLYIFIILLLFTFYQDIILSRTSSNPQKTNEVIVNHSDAYTIAHIKILPGDTVLSITESINSEDLYEMDLQKILDHFAQLNPTTDPYELKPYTFYYFPVYHSD
ncbi:hypothetical protein [Oceanobacillus saliphilus]|uniref:hypothetical protein n=1 Tax=Oceanobacillus saliphilus TaxID=2925834 RepID=UPI00201E0BD0|nr:hypothetical protein [Oceanobacillus saliphilus]